ncbi:MAG TPA: hypothetical protein VLA97_17555 [Nocardioidaceae bacterium]|nr:hypothetical protein [Nocardioidaceae bacterium]
MSATASADAGLPPIGYIAIGWVVMAIGSIMFMNGFGSTYDDYTGEVANNNGLLAFGWLVASIGSIMFLVGVIAQGVKVGNRHSQRVTLQGDR